ncbi:MAG: DNA-directed RNA polymerase subunit alpha, partial [Candidatus Methylomirabilales bacterium]
MLIVKRPQITVEELEEPAPGDGSGAGGRRAKVIVEPLEPGFGYTLGNSLRRTLVSSIPGAAVTTIRMEGVLHEFSTIAGVKEDVTEIILNVKELVLSSELDEPATIRIRATGPKEVTGADIEAPSGVSVLNAQQLICTLNRRGRLDMEMTVERGRGYVPAEQNKSVGAPIGV